MRLQKHKSRRTKTKEYSKYVIVISPERIEALGWKPGLELEDEIKGNLLIIKPSKKEGEHNHD